VGIKNIHKQIAGFFSYVLGRRPDEFGLVPDEDGFVTTKEFLKAVNEEDGWRSINKGTLNELKISMPGPPMEIKGNLIRAVDRGKLPERTLVLEPPKVLFAGITKKSYQAVLEKGILPTRHKYVILAENENLAVRIAKRRDPSPIILTVNSGMAMDADVLFYQKGEWIYLTTRVPVGCFTGPPVPKEKKPSEKSEKQESHKKKQTAGSFILDLQDLGGHKGRRRNKKDGSWKRDKKQIRQEKKKEWPE